MNFADNPSNTSNHLPHENNNTTPSIRDRRATFLLTTDKKPNVKRVKRNELKTPEEEVQPEGKLVKRIALKTPEGEVQPEELKTPEGGVQPEEMKKKSRTTYNTKQRDILKDEIEDIIEKQKSLKPVEQKSIREICLAHDVSLSVLNRWRKECSICRHQITTLENDGMACPTKKCSVKTCYVYMVTHIAGTT